MDKKRQHQFIIKICCVFASFCLWLYIYNVVSPVKNYKLKNVPVELVNVDSISQSKLALISGQKFHVNLSLRGNAAEVYKATPDKFKIVADMSKYVLRKGELNIPVQVIQSPENINIENSETLFISIKLDDLVEKTVPVKINVDGKPKTGYYAFEPIITQSQVTISGAARTVGEVIAVEASGNIRDMDKDTKMMLSLKAVDSGGNNVNEVEINPNNIEVVFSIKKVKTVEVKVKTVGTASAEGNLKSLSTNPDKVEIYGDNDVIDKITFLDTEDIDLSKINESKTIEVNLKVPKGVNLANDSDKVNVKLVLDSVVKKSFSLNLKVKSLIDENTALLESNNVSLVISGSEDVIKNLKSEDLECFVDLNLLPVGEYNLPVDVILPTGVSKVSIDPEMVKVTIKKK